jgi:hypothetical protein
MTVYAITAIALLAIPAVVPTVALVGARPVTIFLVPLAGSVLAAVAAGFELAVGGSLLAWFVVLAVSVNVLAVGRLRSGLRRRSAGRFASPWPWITILVVVVALAWPLQALRNPIVINDGWAIWTLHSAFIYGGHDAFLSDLKNPAYIFSNPGYPPLVPASGALAFISEGRIDIRLAVIVTAILNACGLGVLACGIVEAAHRTSTWAKVAAVAMGATVCLVGMGADTGLAALGGAADLTWAAGGVAAVVYGLVLPRAPRYLVIAWLCATAASLTKNEGLLTAIMILFLIALRYRLTPAGLVRYGRSESSRTRATGAADPSSGTTPSSWRHRGVVALLAAIPTAVVMAAPCLVWALLVWRDGIRSDFFGRAPETVSQRVPPTLVAFADHLHIVPVAVAVAIAGSLMLRGTRSRLGLGNPLWLWLVVAGSLAAIAFTYIFGDLNIHAWLNTSASRTTIFAYLALYADLAVWLVVAVTNDKPADGEARLSTTVDDEYLKSDAGDRQMVGATTTAPGTVRMTRLHRRARN